MKIRSFLFALGAISSLFSLSAFAQTYAITNARIVTVSGAEVSGGTVVVRNGLIESVGADAKVPADAQVLDGSGLTVYPGFFDANTNLGVSTQPRQRTGGGAGGQSGPQQPEQSISNYPDGLRPEESVFDDFNGSEAAFETQRNAGFTTVLTVSRNGIFNGQSAVINLAGDSVSAMIVKSPFAEHVTFTTLRGGVFPGSLLGTFTALRQMLYDAKRLQEVQKMYAANPRGLKRPDDDKSLEALFPVLNREMPVVFNADTEIQIIRALDLAKEFNLKAIIAGGQEAWKAADRLKAQDVPVLLSLNFPKRTAAASNDADPESLEVLRLRAETPKGAGRLAQAGVKFAFQTGGMRTIADFLANAGKSVESGLSKETAIRAMTLTPAEILGVNNQLGSIETGKIANLVVIKGDIFAKDKAITHVFVDGKLFEQKPPAKADERRPGGVGTSPTAMLNVTGAWNITIQIPGQALDMTLNFIQQGSILTGSMQSSLLGNVPIRNGKVSANGFTFDATVTFGGQTFDIAVNGKVSGNQVDGVIDSPQGPVPFSGTKIPN